MGTIADYINRAYDLSRARTQGLGVTMAKEASSMGARSAAASGLAGPIAEKIRAANERKANQSTADALTQSEIARNQALAGAEQFDQNMQFQKDALAKQEEMNKEIAQQQSWNNIWSGLGSLVGNVAGGPIGGALVSALTGGTPKGKTSF